MDTTTTTLPTNFFVNSYSKLLFGQGGLTALEIRVLAGNKSPMKAWDSQSVNVLIYATKVEVVVEAGHGIDLDDIAQRMGEGWIASKSRRHGTWTLKCPRPTDCDLGVVAEKLIDAIEQRERDRADQTKAAGKKMPNVALTEKTKGDLKDRLGFARGELKRLLAAEEDVAQRVTSAQRGVEVAKQKAEAMEKAFSLLRPTLERVKALVSQLKAEYEAKLDAERAEAERRAEEARRAAEEADRVADEAEMKRLERVMAVIGELETKAVKQEGVAKKFLDTIDLVDDEDMKPGLEKLAEDAQGKAAELRKQIDRLNKGELIVNEAGEIIDPATLPPTTSPVAEMTAPTSGPVNPPTTRLSESGTKRGAVITRPHRSMPSVTVPTTSRTGPTANGSSAPPSSGSGSPSAPVQPVPPPNVLGTYEAKDKPTLVIAAIATTKAWVGSHVTAMWQRTPKVAVMVTEMDNVWEGRQTRKKLTVLVRDGLVFQNSAVLAMLQKLEPEAEWTMAEINRRTMFFSERLRGEAGDAQSVAALLQDNIAEIVRLPGEKAPEKTPAKAAEAKPAVADKGQPVTNGKPTAGPKPPAAGSPPPTSVEATPQSGTTTEAPIPAPAAAPAPAEATPLTEPAAPAQPPA